MADLTPPPETSTPHRILGRGSWSETSRIAQLLRQETVGGALLLLATVVALVWANLSPDSYAGLRDHVVGPQRLHLNLSLGTWAADGLLAVFFFLAGIELKHEFLAGDLRDRRKAAIPVVAAVGGMAVPALVFVLLNLGTDNLGGWAIPTATDIAFALAVLAVIGTHLPGALRTFLLTLAVVDDLLAIIVIAVFYSTDLHLGMLALALVPLAAFGLLVRQTRPRWWLLVPLALVTWALVHASGIHATVAGVLLGFTVPLALCHPVDHRLRPFSAGFAVPVFAFFAAGVTVGGWSGLTGSLGDRLTLGVVLGLVVGKAVGVFGSTFLMARLTRAELDPVLRWIDVLGVALLAGIGFTVSLLIGDLAFAGDPHRAEMVKVGVLVGSLAAALLAATVLVSRNRAYRQVYLDETRDDDADGVPDVYEEHGPLSAD